MLRADTILIRDFRSSLSFVLVAVLLLPWSPQAVASPRRAPVKAGGTVNVQMRNASLHMLSDVVLGVVYLRGSMQPSLGKVVSLDDKNSFVFNIDQAETHLTAKDLSALLNEYVLPFAKSPLKNLKITFSGQDLLIQGMLGKGVGVPFQATATLSITPGGSIRVHATQIKAAGVLKKGLLDFLGIKLSTVAQPKKESVFHMEGDDVIAPVSQLFPPPRVNGKLTAIRIDGDEMVMTFGAANPQLTAPPSGAKNYIYFLGGTIRFGKLTMTDVDLQLVDKDPSTAFEFSLDHYYRQLEAGYTQILPSRGILVTVPDYQALAAQK